jgi:hypothetical protein
LEDEILPEASNECEIFRYNVVPFENLGEVPLSLYENLLNPYLILIILVRFPQG